MTKTTLISFFCMLQMSVHAQKSWIDYVKSIKTYFYYQDTIIVKFKTGVKLDSSIKLVSLDTNNKTLFKTGDDTLPQDGDEKYFYSFYLSKSNYATIVLYSDGMWGETGNLYLYNFTPQGKLLTQIKLQDGWADAGTDYKTNSSFINDTTFKVIRRTGFEKTTLHYAYAFTESTYVITEDGRIVQETKKTYEKDSN
jgi:hypothetical protein